MSKKEKIFNTAVRLFASQGYESTTTLQVAREVGVTEPAVFYHFKSKKAFFFTVLEAASQVYFDRYNALDLHAPTAFGSLEAMIRIHFSVVAEEPEYARILVRTCPARLEDTQSTCTRVYRKARSSIKAMLRTILEKGMASGEFNPVDVDATANLLFAMFNGLMRQQIDGMKDPDAVEQGAIAFCRNALVNRT